MPEKRPQNVKEMLLNEFALACYKNHKFGIKNLLPMTKTKIKSFLYEDKEGASSESEDENKIA